VAEPLNDVGLELQAHHAAWATQAMAGDLAGAQQHVARGLQLYDRKAHGSHALIYGGHDPAICGLGHGGVLRWILGYPQQAMDSVCQGITLSETLAHPPSVGHALWFAGLVYMLRGETSAVLDLAERLVGLSSEHGLGQYRAIGRMMRGWACARSGASDAGLAEFGAAILDYKRTAFVFVVFYLTALVEVELLGGHIDHATARIDDAIAHKGDVIWYPRLLRIRADVQTAQPRPDLRAAELLYKDALSAARRVDAKSFELEAALGLARLWGREGRQQEARSLLEPVYSWFSEGFDTASLKDARAVLDQLR
jgi:predicted ATPase